MQRLMTLLAGLVLMVVLPAWGQDTDDYPFTQAELDQMLAPIALYPDTVLAHVLIAATYPLEVVQAERWAREHPQLQGENAVAAVENKDWDPSVKALVPFPDILERMSEDLEWTQRLGDAFLEDEARVMASVQSLRQHAYDAGNLDSLEHVNVERDADVIVIEPAVREVVYIPYYDTHHIYGHWWWDHYPPVRWYYPRHHHVSHHVYWSPRIHVTWGFFFTGFHWHDHRVLFIDHHYHRRHVHYSSRHVVHDHRARHWRHNPVHRRGVAYHTPRARRHYGDVEHHRTRQRHRDDYEPGRPRYIRSLQAERSHQRQDQARNVAQQRDQRAVRAEANRDRAQSERLRTNTNPGQRTLNARPQRQERAQPNHETNSEPQREKRYDVRRPAQRKNQQVQAQHSTRQAQRQNATRPAASAQRERQMRTTNGLNRANSNSARPRLNNNRTRAQGRSSSSSGGERNLRRAERD